ncbi:hypothetical protein OG352_12225 [Streptomyces sp. NBC_01485]|uniref:hypothetical protein n=1 Tax=Streptomyces sp. NBC_01485 TaxID=2903884 RepID=UPI002E310774|nr:hypothetical protein [Streptomyces sp. NBC_01485]
MQQPVAVPGQLILEAGDACERLGGPVAAGAAQPRSRAGSSGNRPNAAISGTSKRWAGNRKTSAVYGAVVSPAGARRSPRGFTSRTRTPCLAGTAAGRPAERRPPSTATSNAGSARASGFLMPRAWPGRLESAWSPG